MTGNVAFLMKDLLLLAASIYLLKQDVTASDHGPPGRDGHGDAMRPT